MAKAKTTKKADPLDTLLNNATEVDQKKPASKKANRSVQTLDGEKATVFDQFCMADATLKLAKGHQESSKSIVLPALIDDLLQLWCEEGHRTENPRIQTENGQAILQAREVLKFEIPSNENGEDGTAADLLVAAGFDHDKAEEISEKEFTTTTELRFANISKLREDEASAKVVDKLLRLVVEKFTPSERAVLLEKVTRVNLKEGFLDRSIAHAEGDPKLLKSLLSVIRPQFLLSQIVWKGELQDAVQTLQGTSSTPKLESTIAVPTNAIPKEFKSDDGEWIASFVGNVATLFMANGDSPIEMVKKTCSGGATHAEQTCKKWVRDSEYRKESIGNKSK